MNNQYMSSNLKMDNAEEVMQLLEEFSKMRPKEIPRELEEYLGYVAKTGDPVFQWSLVKSLFREKLHIVITDFFESTLTIELPTCPNVEPFNYERMKTCLLERLDSFSSAPFTIQRICELLTNPRKEYNRADKYMRAIEKNILVVSTREPGSVKRPLECDGQSDNILNGIPDIKLHASDGSILHVTMDLPYLGAPPASNDVIIETTESTSLINDRVGLSLGLDVNGDSTIIKTESQKPWQHQETSTTLVQESESHEMKPETSLDLESSSIATNKSLNQLTYDANTSKLNVLITDNAPKPNTSSSDFDSTSDSSLNINSKGLNTLPDSIYSSDSSEECIDDANVECEDIEIYTSEENEVSCTPSEENEVSCTPSEENEVTCTPSEENEVSCTPSEENEVSCTPSNSTTAPNIDTPSNEDKVEETTDSEAEATTSSPVPNVECTSQTEELHEEEDVNSTDEVGDSEGITSITITEVTVVKKDEIDLECNEITETVILPISPENCSQQTDDIKDKINLEIVEESKDSDSCPDSSIDLCSQHDSEQMSEEKTDKPGSSSEADSVSEDDPKSDTCLPPDIHSTTDSIETGKMVDVNNSSQTLPPIVNNLSVSETGENLIENSAVSDSSEVLVSEIQCTTIAAEDKKTDEAISDVAEKMLEQEKREESVIQPSSSTVSDSQKEEPISSIEEDISIDQSCEAEEAMDVDDTSNQMMVTEVENESEPMDQSEQQQS